MRFCEKNTIPSNELYQIELLHCWKGRKIE